MKNKFSSHLMEQQKKIQETFNKRKCYTTNFCQVLLFLNILRLKTAINNVNAHIRKAIDILFKRI